MENNKKIGRIAGVFLFLMMAAGLPGVMYRGLGSSMLENQDLLKFIVDSSGEMRLSIFLSVSAGIMGTIFSVIVYKVLKQHSTITATLFLGLWLIQVAISLVGDVSHYVMLETAQYLNDTNQSTQDFLPFAALGIKGYIGSHFLGLLFFSGSFVLIHSQFLRFELLPKWISIWGMLATGTVFTVTWLQIFDQDVSFYFYQQNGIFMLSFTAFMLIKGFSNTETENS
ncbi:MAG: DUF4386 domain-containing protein [bacterium]|nr:DUF4386 domain-containing protein [bacterium]